MSEIITGTSVTEASELVRRLASFLTNTPDSVQARFDRLIADIDAGSPNTTYVADVLATLIHDSLINTSRTLVIEADRRRFMHDVIRNIDRTFGDLLRISKTTQIYASDLQEIWIACEPMLDLLPEPHGFLDTVAHTLSCKSVRYKYFLSNASYYSDLNLLLKSRGLADEQLGLLQLIPMPEPYVPPVAIYIHKTRLIGFRGMERPPLIRNGGEWKLQVPLSPDWATVLEPESLSRHYRALSAYLTPKEDAQ